MMKLSTQLILLSAIKLTLAACGSNSNSKSTPTSISSTNAQRQGQLAAAQAKLPPAPVPSQPAQQSFELDSTWINDTGQPDVIGSKQFSPAVGVGIPSFLDVTVGDAGNGQAELDFTDSSGNLIICFFQGGASVPNPDPTSQDFLNGVLYSKFVSCQNQTTSTPLPNLTPGQIVPNVVNVKLQVDSADNQEQEGSTAVDAVLYTY